MNNMIRWLMLVLVSLYIVSCTTANKTDSLIPFHAISSVAQRTEQNKESDKNSVRFRQEPARITISFSLAEESLSLHEPIFLNLKIENNLGQQVKLYLGQNREESLLISVKRPDGLVIHLPQRIREGISIPGEVTLSENQTYNQKFLLNKLFDFSEVGKYELAIRLVTSKLNPTPLIQTQSGETFNESETFQTVLEIKPRDVNRLNQVCKDLSEQVINSSSVAESSQAAEALSYINDPIAIPYLKEILDSDQMVENIAVEGLERIGGKEAITVLRAELKTQSKDTVEELIKPALTRLKSSPETLNPQ